ncbi:MAG TPA: NADH-quinone oxidoreductase subunit N [Bacteroidia bacterium]|jgi:NADH-quinone oxidoreductase subunit N|nr:NADH-quinone oxidoreductase subunit N [Bacteroidia bacterium]HRG51814.1 NADH-quinone oxidoreductase subunit N [Bacteroidia bacterium]
MKALILLSSLGVITLLAEIFSFKKVLYPIVLLGLATIFVFNAMEWNTDMTYFKMMRYDNYAIAFSSVILLVAFLWFLMSQDFFKDETNKTDHYALAIFALTGAVLMVSYTNMSMLFLGIEILSIPMYILAGSRKEDVLSNEAAFKYLIMGAFATGFLLFGIVLVYGSTGSFDLAEIAAAVSGQTAIPSIFYVGVLLMLIGLSFKVSAVPFHFWAPDVYQGAPTVITAFMSTIVKTAAFAAFLRLFSTSFATVGNSWHQVLWVIAALTLLIGNITAVLQTSTKRMLAYSSVAHAGYMLLALLSGNSLSNSSILMYALAYSIASIGTFCIISIIDKARDTDAVDAFNGLGKSNPFLAGVMTVALLSLAGIPPTAGFFAKYYIFTSAFAAGNVSLVLIAIVASLVGVYYYFRIIIGMYFKEGSKEKIELSANHKALLIIVALATIALGLFPDCIIGLL